MKCTHQPMTVQWNTANFLKLSHYKQNRQEWIQVFRGVKLIQFRGTILRKEIEKKTSRKSGTQVNTLEEKKI